MDADRWQQVQTVFLEALPLEAEARNTFLSQACQGDEELRGEVDDMLYASDSSEMALERGLFRDGAPAPEPSTLLNTRIGPHRLIRLLGRGGMGDVFLAERDDGQFRHSVALKLARPGLEITESVARFRAERQILAHLTHPNIATLLDGGITEDDRPYLVMQYVDGCPIDEFCDQNRLSIEERLHLFHQVCEAVQFAHQNLVVHRDLKPSNILVTEDGTVQLLDFGIAKLLDTAGSDAPLTRHATQLMTPEYAAPEQVRSAAITTMTDIYSLGVLLYVLLTGRPPYRLAHRSPTEIDSIICERIPTRPSDALSAALTTTDSGRSGDDQDAPNPEPPSDPKELAAARGLSLGRLRRILRGDLDKIVLMALRKEPQRRYQSAEALGEDLRRFLEGRPVAAQNDAVGYRLLKFVLRNRLAVATTAVSFVILAVLATTMTIQAARISRHADELELERDRVQREVEKARQVRVLVNDLFKAVDPHSGEESPAERLEAASRRIIQDLQGQPELQVELMDEVITIYVNLGRYDAARSMAESALTTRRGYFEPTDPLVAKGLARLGETQFLQGRFAEAETSCRASLELLRASPDRPTDTARVLVLLSRVLRSTARYEEAIATANEAHEFFQDAFGEIHASTAEAIYHLAYAKLYVSGPESAVPLFQRALDIRRQALGDQHPDVAWTLVSLAQIAYSQQDLDGAEPLLEEALAIHQERYGEDHPDLSRTRNWVGRVYEARHRYEKAEAEYRKVLDSRKRSLGIEHTATAAAMVSVARLLTRRRQFEEAESLLLEALPAAQARLDSGHPATFRVLGSLVDLYDAWGRPQKSEEYGRILKEATARSGGDFES